MSRTPPGNSNTKKKIRIAKANHLPTINCQRLKGFATSDSIVCDYTSPDIVATEISTATIITSRFVAYIPANVRNRNG